MGSIINRIIRESCHIQDETRSMNVTFLARSSPSVLLAIDPFCLQAGWKAARVASGLEHPLSLNWLRFPPSSGSQQHHPSSHVKSTFMNGSRKNGNYFTVLISASYIWLHSVKFLKQNSATLNLSGWTGWLCKQFPKIYSLTKISHCVFAKAILAK